MPAEEKMMDKPSDQDKEIREALEKIEPAKLLYCISTVPTWMKEGVIDFIKMFPEAHEKMKEYEKERIKKMIIELSKSDPPTYRGTPT